MIKRARFIRFPVPRRSRDGVIGAQRRPV